MTIEFSRVRVVLGVMTIIASPTTRTRRVGHA